MLVFVFLSINDYYILLVVLSSLTSSLQKIENAHKFTRWLPTSTEYLEHLRKLEVEEKEKMLHQLRRNASERGFLVSLLSKYSSKPFYLFC